MHAGECPLTLLTLNDVHVQYTFDRPETIPDYVFKKLKSLRSLDISDCPRLKSVSQGVSELQALRLLAVRRCQCLTVIPKCISELLHLTSLDLAGCCSLRSLPDAMEPLRHLQRLCLQDCSSISSLPPSTRRLIALTHLVLAGCENLDSLPHLISVGEQDEPAKAKPMQGLDMPEEPTWVVPTLIVCAKALCTWVKIKTSTASSLNTPVPGAHCRLPRQGDTPALDAQTPINLNGKQPKYWRSFFASWHTYVILVQSIIAGTMAGLLLWTARHGLVDKPMGLVAWASVGAGLGVLHTCFMRCMEIRHERRPHVSKRCLVDTSGSGLPPASDTQAYEPGVSEWKLSGLVAALEVRRQEVVLHRLLRDRAGRRAALEKLSIIAVLIATTALLSFEVSPSTATAFNRMSPPVATVAVPAEVASIPAEAAPTSRSGNMTSQQLVWLEVFYEAQQTSFVLSMITILFVMVTGIPANEAVDPLVTAGSIWAQFSFGCLLLLLALMSSIFAFFAGGLAVYPDTAFDEKQPWFKLTCWLLMWIVYLWSSALYRICPGRQALLAYGLHLLNAHVWRKPVVSRAPPRGPDEVSAEMLQRLAELHARFETIEAAAGSWLASQEGAADDSQATSTSAAAGVVGSVDRCGPRRCPCACG